MKKLLTLLGVLGMSVAAWAQTLNSPDGNLKLTYSLEYKDKQVVKESKMGFVLKPALDFSKNFSVVDTEFFESTSTWNPVLGQYREIEDNHKEMLVELKQEKTGWLLNIRFRLFDDGLGFRYEFPVQGNLRNFTLVEELTEFCLAGDHKAFWIPADYDTNEFPITTSKLSEVAGLIDKVREEPLAAKAPTPGLAVQTPLMLKSDDGLYINIHEAALVNYPAMCLNLDDKNFVMSSHLTPDKNGNKGFIQTGSVTPWRTLVVSDDARDILASNLILNLNEPCKLEDTSWIKPTKYVGVWWEYFVGGGSTWSYTDCQDIVIGQTDYTKLKPHGHHGANTAHVKEYIDFAAENGMDAVLVEGWNEGWEANFAYIKEYIYSFTKPYPDFDVEELQRYAASKGVKIIMHHETTSSQIAEECRDRNGYQLIT